MTTPFTVKILGEGEPNLNFEIDLSQSKWNTVGGHQLVRITGLVKMKICFYISSSVTATGVVDVSSSFHSLTRAYDLDAGELWYDGDGSVADGNLEDLIFSIIRGSDINFIVHDGESLTGGKIRVLCWWEKLASGVHGIAEEGDGT